MRPFYRRVKLTEKKPRGRKVAQKAGVSRQKIISINSDIHDRFQAAYKLESDKYLFDISIQQFFTVLLNLYEENRDDSSVG